VSARISGAASPSSGRQPARSTRTSGHGTSAAPQAQQSFTDAAVAAAEEPADDPLLRRLRPQALSSAVPPTSRRRLQARALRSCLRDPSSAGICTVSGVLVSLVGVGTLHDRREPVRQRELPGAPQVQQSFGDRRASQTISFHVEPARAMRRSKTSRRSGNVTDPASSHQVHVPRRRADTSIRESEIRVCSRRPDVTRKPRLAVAVTLYWSPRPALPGGFDVKLIVC